MSYVPSVPATYRISHYDLRLIVLFSCIRMYIFAFFSFFFLFFCFNHSDTTDSIQMITIQNVYHRFIFDTFKCLNDLWRIVLLTIIQRSIVRLHWTKGWRLFLILRLEFSSFLIFLYGSNFSRLLVCRVAAFFYDLLTCLRRTKNHLRVRIDDKWWYLRWFVYY